MSLPDLLDASEPRPPVQALLRSWLRIQAVYAARPRQTVSLLERVEDPHEALGLLASEPCEPIDVEAAVARLRAAGVVAVPLASRAYPARLARLPDRPPLLFVKGDCAALSRRAVAVVGARAPTAYGRRVARELGSALALQGLVVVSGLASGIDAEAHHGTLEAGGLTVAVQGRGPDDVYPARHRQLAGRIVGQGALVSEFLPGVPPLPHHFPRRNRLIACLAECVVVVEARERSGSLSTAGHALDQGSDVLAVPGPITAATSAGTNRLLAEGAAPCRHVDDVLGVLRLPPAREPVRPLALPRSQLGRAILTALADEPATPDALVRRLHERPEALAAELLELELAGSVAREPDGTLRIVARHAGA